MRGRTSNSTSWGGGGGQPAGPRGGGAINGGGGVRGLATELGRGQWGGGGGGGGQSEGQLGGGGGVSPRVSYAVRPNVILDTRGRSTATAISYDRLA